MAGSKRGRWNAPSACAIIWTGPDWPGLAQVCRIHRHRSTPGGVSDETVYAITSLSRERADDLAIPVDRRESDGALVQVNADEGVEMSAKVLTEDFVPATFVHDVPFRVRGCLKNFCYRKHTRSRRPLHGFTLVELLVVMTILSLLASMLLSSLGKALESARGIHCANNQRQFHQATMLFVGDNNEAFPVTDFWNSWPDSAPDNDWHYQLDLYLTGKLYRNWNYGLTYPSQLYHCPKDVASRLPSQRICNVSYFANMYVFRCWKKNTSGNIVPELSFAPMRPGRIQAPSKTLLFGEATGLSIRRDKGAVLRYRLSEGWKEEFRDKSHSWGGFFTPHGFSTMLHQEKANYIAVDGHFKSLYFFEIGEFYTDKSAEFTFVPRPITDPKW